MKKITRVLALALAAMMALTACSNGDNNSSSSASGSSAAGSSSAASNAGEPKAFTFWDKSEYVAAYNELSQKKVKEFEEKNNAKVDYVIVPSNDQKQKLMAAIEANNAPDLIVSDDMVCAEYYSMGQLADVSDVVDKLDLIDSAKNISQLKGETVLVPLCFLAPGMYWRKDKWEEKGLSQPKTWEELKSQGEQVNDPAGGFYAFGFAMGASGGGDAESFCRSVTLAFGGEPVDKDGKVTINSPETKQAFEYIASLYQENLCPPDAITGDDSWNNNAFLAGTVGIIFNAGSVWSKLKEDKNPILDGTQVIPYPSGPSGKSFVLGGSNTYAIFKTGKNPDVAKEFVSFVLEDKEGYNTMIEAMGGMWQPVFKGMDDTEFWKDPLNSGWLANSQNIVRNFHPAPADDKANLPISNQVMVKAIQNIVVNGMDVQAALDQCEQEFKAIYEK